MSEYTTIERDRKILEELEKKQSVTVPALSDMLGVSEVTIRKDLKRLEERGRLQRTFGGAIPRKEDTDSQQRINSIRRIALRTAEEIRDGDSVILNAGSTTLLIAHQLLGRKNLKVITNSVKIGRELSQHANIQLIMLGGELGGQAVFTYGEHAAEQLRQYKADKLILSVNGISAESGLSTRHAETTNLFCRMIERASHVIVPAEEAKFGFESLYSICGIKEADKIITNCAGEGSAARGEIEKIRALGIEVVEV